MQLMYNGGKSEDLDSECVDHKRYRPLPSSKGSPQSSRGTPSRNANFSDREKPNCGTEIEPNDYGGVTFRDIKNFHAYVESITTPVTARNTVSKVKMQMNSALLMVCNRLKG